MTATRSAFVPGDHVMLGEDPTEYKVYGSRWNEKLVGYEYSLTLGGQIFSDSQETIWVQESQLQLVSGIVPRRTYDRLLRDYRGVLNHVNRMTTYLEKLVVGPNPDYSLIAMTAPRMLRQMLDAVPQSALVLHNSSDDPRYQPHCSSCIFVGAIDAYDCWYCLGAPGDEDRIVARSSSVSVWCPAALGEKDYLKDILIKAAALCRGAGFPVGEK